MQTMGISETTHVAEVAARYPGTIKVFQQHAVDFCCGGKKPLSEVCGARGLDPSVLLAELRAAIAASPGDTAVLNEAPLDTLTRHIETRYHAHLREELLRVEAMMQKVQAVHGARHPELEAVASVLFALRDDVLPHMLKEEHVLFPFISGMVAAEASGAPLNVPFGTVQNPIRMMEMEHEAVGALLVELRRLTSDFQAPEDACNTFRGLYHAFAEIERDTHEHIHVENNILHPRAVKLEARLLGRQAV